MFMTTPTLTLPGNIYFCVSLTLHQTEDMKLTVLASLKLVA